MNDHSPNDRFDKNDNYDRSAADPFQDWDAAYVMGMLGADERRAFERHLAECPRCTAEMAELAGIPAVLGRLTPDEAVTLLEPGATPVAPARDRHTPDRVQELARTVRRRTQTRRRRFAGALIGTGALLVAAGVITVVTVTGAGTSPVPAVIGAEAVSMSQVQPGWIDADIAVTEASWGTRFDWSCSYRETWDASGDPVTYDLVVTDAGGAETTVATWTARGDAAGDLSASTSIPTPQIRAVDIRVAGSDQAIVRTVL